MTEEIFSVAERGFLPAHDPLKSLPSEFQLWDELGRALPKLLLSAKLRQTLRDVPVLVPSPSFTHAQLERAMLLLSFLGHAYVWGADPTQNKIPASIAIPWFEVSKQLGRHPILSYASYALNNWLRLDEQAPIALGNIVLLQNFLGGIDEEWFVLVHVDIEMKAARALKLFFAAQKAVLEQNIDEISHSLDVIRQCLEEMCKTLDRMPEHCDPYIYYNRVRPYIHGWKDNPALPEGIIYEGVMQYENKPQQFRGETGAQSSIIPAFDAFFGVEHQIDPLRIYLNEMREYMPVAHRAFIQQTEENGSIRNFILATHKSYPALRELYNDCLHQMALFRQTHLHYAAHYIQKQSQNSLANPTDVGTGGTPFMQYLRKHKDETLQCLIKP